MAIPKYNEFFPAFIRALSDGKEHEISEIRVFCAKKHHVGEEDLAVTHSSGVGVFVDRIGWSRTYLKKAGLIECPRRGFCKLTKEGLKASKEADKVTLSYLRKYPSFIEFVSTSNKSVENETSKDTSSTAKERLEQAWNDLNNSLSDDLLDEILKLSDVAFEQLAVDLLLKMGYGSPVHNQNAVTKKSGDEGVDGKVIADEFGFNAVYTQAKKWKKELKVGRPVLQQFCGAMTGLGATKGIFVTTTKFTQEAVEYAKSLKNMNIILVDGGCLTALMIKYDLGVATERVYPIKHIDMDYFSKD